MNEMNESKPAKAPGAKMKALADGSRHSAESIGMSGAILLAWGLTTWGGVAMPAEVSVAMGTMIGAVAARIKG